MSDRALLEAAVEAVLFAAPEPVTVAGLASILSVEAEAVDIAIAGLSARYDAPSHGVSIRAVAGGYQILTKPEFASDIERLVQPERTKLSRAAMECLAIVAYRQPITRGEIEDVRGVQSGYTIRTLEKVGLVAAAGRADAPGRPILYQTTPHLLSYLGLDSLADLPPLTLPGETADG